MRLFASARVAAGAGRDRFCGLTVGDVLDAASVRYGAAFAAVLSTSKVWCNGEPVEGDHELQHGDEIAVLPPVSGG